MHQTEILVGIDVGGTFTDFVVLTGDTLRVFKAPTTASPASSSAMAPGSGTGAALWLKLSHSLVPPNWLVMSPNWMRASALKSVVPVLASLLAERTQ